LKLFVDSGKIKLALPIPRKALSTGGDAMLIDEVPMNRLILSRPGSIVALLLAALSISGCDCNPNSSPYGGPYHIGGDTGKIDPIMANNKNAEFAAFKNKGWDSSEVKKLDGSNPSSNKAFFEDSIKSNSLSNVPDAKKFQRYNYVVKGEIIYVAVWRNKESSLNDICHPGMPYPTQKMIIRPNTMVNFYPESKPESKYEKSDSDIAACASTIGNDKGTRVLDAHSKHFMLAQGPGSTISDYDLAKHWENTTIDYAGEIMVFLESPPCYYGINNQSGTYAPKTGPSGKDKDFEYLKKVMERFKVIFGVAPAFAQGADVKVHWFELPPPQSLQCM
jgi:hypothetical protein